MIPRAMDFTLEIARAASPSASSSSLACIPSPPERAVPITSSPAPASSPAPDCCGGGLDCDGLGSGGLDGGGLDSGGFDGGGLDGGLDCGGLDG